MKHPFTCAAPIALVCVAVLATSAGCAVHPDQAADPHADLTVSTPAFPPAEGPRMTIDGAHNNFHTSDGRFAPFAELMANDGLRVGGSTADFTDASLADVDILVISNAISDENEEPWAHPNPSAFSPEEIAAVERFVSRGGALLLIADHMPFGGAAANLAAQFGISFDDGFAQDGDSDPDLFTQANGGLSSDPLLDGITQIRSFTGSAFTAPQSARPILLLGPQWTIRLPDEAWEFTDNTPEVSGADRLQGALLAHGEGRIAIFGEAAMFTAQLAGPEQVPVGLNAPGAEQNKELVLRVTRWLAAD